MCIDLDGTLLQDDKTVSKENLDAINFFKSEGGLFTVITGRMPIISEDVCKTVEPNAKIIFAEDEDEVIVGLADALNTHPLAERFAFIRSQFDLYEILPKGITKATALEKLTEHLGIDIKKTIALGDYNNDIAMLKRAGIGIATGNACPDAKAVADRVTVSNKNMPSQG